MQGCRSNCLANHAVDKGGSGMLYSVQPHPYHVASNLTLFLLVGIRTWPYFQLSTSDPKRG